jgi:hypothetical protein
MAAAFAGGTITSVMSDCHRARADYRFLDRPEVTHQAVQSGHCALVLAATAEQADYQFIEDTSALDFKGLLAAKGLCRQ